MDPNVKTLGDLLVSICTYIFQTYTASIVIIGAYIGVDRLLYLHEKYINWKTGRKKS